MSDFKPRPRRRQTPQERLVGGHGLAPKNPDPHACMYVFFDLSCTAIDFGVSEFIILGIENALQRGLEQVHIVYVPAANDSLRIHGTPDRLSEEWRVQNILLQMPWLSPMICGVTWCTTREQADMMLGVVGPNIFPSNYNVQDEDSGYLSCHASREVILNHQGRDFRHLRATDSSLLYMKRWMKRFVGDKKAVVITLRETQNDPERNSNIAQWVDFAKSLDPSVYCPVFVRDTDVLFGGVSSPRSTDEKFIQAHNQALKDLEDFPSCDEAALNLHARCALYELSYANLAVPSGPVIMCIYNRKPRYVSFRITVDNAYSTSMDYLNWIGMEKDKSFPFGGPTQKLVWEEDTFEVISREFKLLVKNIEIEERQAES